MINLVGNINANKIIKEELLRANIPIEKLQSNYGEIDTNIQGLLKTKYGDIVFRRAWTYWIVSGLIPLEEANKLYDHPEAKASIRAGGDCRKAPPSNFITYYNDIGQILLKDSEINTITSESLIKKIKENPKFCFVPDPSSGTAVVDTFHIDEQSGLLLFVQTLLN